MRDLYIRRMSLPEPLPFKETDHYRTTVRFLQNPESAVAEILGREEE